MELDEHEDRNGRQQVWVGIDVGKGHHWASAVDEKGRQVWARKILNEEADILTAIGVVLDLADRVSWAVDITSGPAGLLLAMLADRGRRRATFPAGP